MLEKFGLNDKINVGRNKKVLVSELAQTQGEIFKYIKKGYIFDDEVLELAKIKKEVRDDKVSVVIVDRQKPKEKPLPKETDSLKNILKSINTLDNIAEAKYLQDGEYNGNTNEGYEETEQ